MTTTRRLRWYADEGRLDDLHLIKQRLLALDTNGVRHGLSIALAIQGLGTAGTSGLLALMYPQTFATVDQFVLKALRRVRNLPEAVTLGKMHEHALSLKAGVLLIDIMQRKATENNRIFDSADWTLSTARQHSVTSFRGRHPGERRGPVSSWIPACAGMTCGNIPPMLDTGL